MTDQPTVAPRYWVDGWYWDKAEANKGKARTFDTGATRDTDERKHDYEGFLSPLVIRAFGHYMHENRVQSDGQLRDSDNWQKGIPKDAYMKSMWRHFLDVWTVHRDELAEDFDGQPVSQIDALCGLLFNVQGYLHVLLTEGDSWLSE